jgi:hypothetical protein
MLKWKILAVLGLTFGVAGMVWGYAKEKKAVGFYELRIYTAQPGKRDALAERFASRTAAIFARHGITNVGYWIPQQSDPEVGSAPKTPSFMCEAILPKRSATSASRRCATTRSLPR